ncbi:hypothetical protein F7725_028025 [Dissostichus mawsoni]|uniref:Glutaredoxin domain-containing protein n=1 Tax=Dissostichus mawsoni TaxID=36200 RepID=A0A7J5XFU1_DISMA|nr:hypothetical protein F7725_028025 [Dissostichus mawsoni]
MRVASGTASGGHVRMGNFTSSTSVAGSSCVQYVQEMVSQNCVVIFSKSTCPYCKMAKNVFNEIGATYKVIELDEHNDGRRMQEALAQMTGARTSSLTETASGVALIPNNSISREVVAPDRAVCSLLRFQLRRLG